MHVYIMRHGDAALDAPSDAQRPLTHCGLEETRQMSHWLAAQHSSFDTTLVSPYLRAQQTFSQLSEQIAETGKIETHTFLAPSGEATQVADYLHALGIEGIDSVLVISHLPLVGYLVAELCPDESAPMFATAGIAYIDYDVKSARGKLCWQVSPSKLAAAI